MEYNSIAPFVLPKFEESSYRLKNERILLLLLETV